MRQRYPLGHYLASYVSPEELDQAVKLQKRTKSRVGQLLVDLGLLSEENLYKALSEQLGHPVLTDENFPEAPMSLGQENWTLFMRNYHVLPLERTRQGVRLVVADPLDLPTLDSIKLAMGVEDFDLCIAPKQRIDKWLDTYYGHESLSVDSIVDGMDEDELEILGGDDEEDINQLRDMASEAPVIRLVNLLISQAIEKRASDIHIEPFERDLRIRYRVDGILHEAETPPKRLQAAIISRVKIMANLNIAERRLPQDGRIKMRVAGKKIDLRVSSIPTQFGESVVMRILDRSSILLSIEDLGFPEDFQKIFLKMIHLPHGIFLVTGPTGSGKTTTLYAALNQINTADKKIITVEDPVEYQLPGVNQIQVNPKIGLTFSSGLRSIVRQDPDVILVGEIRDTETAEIAIQSALTGHLVFSTLHTNDAPSSITRLTDMNVESFLVSSVIEGILAQRLVRLLCDHCSRYIDSDPGLLRDLRTVIPDLPDSFRPRQGQGCDECGGTGYMGRKGIFELLVINEEIRSLINQNSPVGDLRKAARRAGMRTLREDGWLKVIRHETTVEEVVRVTQEDEFVII